MSNTHGPKKIHKTLVWGGWYGSRNIGDTAILLGIKELYKKINYDRHYYLRFLSTDIDYTSTNGVTGKRALHKSDIIKPWRWLEIILTFYHSDLVIISGGTPIFDFSHIVRSVYFFLPIVLRKPFLFLGIGVKPIQNAYGKKYIPFVMNRSFYTSVRDTNSEKIVTDLGIRNVIQTADSAFFAQPASQEQLNTILSKYGIKPSDRILVVAPRLMSPNKKQLYLDEDMDINIINDTPEKIAKSVKAVSKKFDKVVFMAMHYYGPDSDVSLINDIIVRTETNNCVFINEELRPEIAIALFKHAYMVLAMRLHALLLSSSMYTPVVGISYETKVRDLFKRLQLDTMCVDLFNFTTNDLETNLVKVYEDREIIHKHLEKRVSKLRTLVLKDAGKVLRISDTFSDVR